MLVKWLVKRFTFTLQTVKWLFCGFDRFWNSKWTSENGHFSNSEWASASRFIYYLKIDHLLIYWGWLPEFRESASCPVLCAAGWSSHGWQVVVRDRWSSVTGGRLWQVVVRVGCSAGRKLTIFSSRNECKTSKYIRDRIKYCVGSMLGSSLNFGNDSVVEHLRKKSTPLI